MALQKNKVKFGLNKVHWAKITAWSDDGVPTLATPVRLPGAVSLSSMPTAKTRTSMLITAFIMSSTTTQATTAIWK